MLPIQNLPLLELEAGIAASSTDESITNAGDIIVRSVIATIETITGIIL